MLAPISIKGLARSYTRFVRRESIILSWCRANEVLDPSLPTNTYFTRSLTHHLVPIQLPRPVLEVPLTCHLVGMPSEQRSDKFGYQGDLCQKWVSTRYFSKQSVELKMENDVIRFAVSKRQNGIDYPQEGNAEKKSKRVKMSKRAKVNQLKLYRLMARKKMNSPNPEVRIRYKLEKAKRKEAWLIEKLRKFEVPKAPEEEHDPEILTEEEKHYLKRTGEKKKHYVPIGRRGVFGGVVLNMHLHWKKHETVKVIFRPCKPAQLPEYAKELAHLSKGIVIDIKHNSTIIFYRGKNYVQPDVMSPPNTLSKEKALAKYKFLQSLEHTSQFIEKLEKELEDYHNHLARFNQTKHKNANANQHSPVNNNNNNNN